MPVEIQNAIEDQRRELATAMTVLHCLHCVLRREADYTSPDEMQNSRTQSGGSSYPT
jgi:hypothetical protein